MKVSNVLECKGSGAVLSMSPSATLAEFVREACRQQVGAMLVTDNQGHLVGILTERDVLLQCNAGADFRTCTIGEVMTRQLITVDLEDDIKIAMDLMVGKRIRHLPVISAGGVAGLITLRDIVQAMRQADQEEVRRLVEYLQSSIQTRYGASAEASA